MNKCIDPYSLLGDVASVQRQAKIDKLVRKYVKVTLVKSGNKTSPIIFNFTKENIKILGLT